MHNAESVLENETHKLLWDFETQTDYLISDRRPDQVKDNRKKKKMNKKKKKIVNFTVPADRKIKLKESEKRGKYLDFARELKKYEKWKWRWYQY